jgi:hypothetical protein
MVISLRIIRWVGHKARLSSLRIDCHHHHHHQGLDFHILQNRLVSQGQYSINSFWNAFRLHFFKMMNLVKSSLSVKLPSATNVQEVFILYSLSRYVSTYLMSILRRIVQIIQSCYSCLVQLCV